MRRAIYILPAMLAGCATLNTTLPSAPPEQFQAESDIQHAAAYDKYMDSHERLIRISRPILAANAPLCDKTREDIGAVTMRLKGLPKALRPLAKARLGFVGKEPRVLLAGGSGLKIGAIIKGPNGKPISAYSEALDIPPYKTQTVCDYPVRLKYSAAVNAYADGRHITVTTGLMEFASDEHIALIVGHELAHNTQGHIRKIIQNTILALGRGTFARQFESEADYVGLYYSARAGYAIDGAEQLWRKMGLRSVKSISVAKSHPVTPLRFIQLKAASAEIAAKRTAGEPLEPNYR